MWQNLTPDQQQFLTAMLMGQQQPGMMSGTQQPNLGNALMAANGTLGALNGQQGSSPMGGNWFDWLNGGAQSQYMQQQAALAQTQQTGYLPPEQWAQQQMAPQAQQQQMNPWMQMLQQGWGAMGSQPAMPTDPNAQGQQQQRLPDYSGGGPNYSPYAMPGTVQWNG